SKLPNVLYATIGDKRTSGERTGETAAVAYVLEKADMPSVHRLPRMIHVPGKEGNKTRALRTDVVALPSMPRAFGVRSGHIIQGFDGDIGVCS
ncbi:hypothetical protein, partial [Klebsiella variicola]|uniref:hypothetical protein n=1 Tax=Klebsiella variicola TaxID=244366 RepID=UPI0013D3398C